jgi:hypothetical protein
MNNLRLIQDKKNSEYQETSQAEISPKLATGI